MVCVCVTQTIQSIKQVLEDLLKLRRQLICPYITKKRKDALCAEITNKLDWGNRSVTSSY